MNRRSVSLAAALLLTTVPASSAFAQAASAAQPVIDGQQVLQSGKGNGRSAANTAAGVGSKDAPSQTDKQAAPAGQDKSSASKPATGGSSEVSASVTKLKLGPLDPSTPPTNVPHNRPVIGVAMGGGAALGMSEIGTLQWMEEHHIPVDVIAGTSMGSILAALYSTGKTPEQMKHILTDQSVNRVFRIGADYEGLNYRRREESREIPAGLGVGLKHGVSLRNSLLTDTGLNELLDREFMAYNDQTDFNNLPIPFRCQATDLNDAKTVTFARGSLQNAVRASASIPGVFRPFEMNGHEFVDGAILQNLPTQDLKSMKADVIIAISLPLSPVGKGDLDSILGVLQRAFSVGIEANEANSRKLANVVVMPDTSGFTANSYLETDKLAKRGYEAAEKHKDELMKYALSDADWDAYIAHKRSLMRPAPGNVIRVTVHAPNSQVKSVVETIFAPVAGKPINLDDVEKRLSDVRSDGRYDADYTIGYADADSNEPIILVDVRDKKTGPPFLDLGFDLQAQTGGVTRATVATIFKWQDLGGYGSSLRANIDLGFRTRAELEYYWKPQPLGHFFLAPRAGITRRPYYIYQGDYRVSERQSQYTGVAGDAGWSDNKYQEARVGIDFENVQWTATTGFDNYPDYGGNATLFHGHYVYDNQDRALVPSRGMRAVFDAGYWRNTTLSALTNTVSAGAPKFTGQIEAAHTLSKKNTFLFNIEGGTLGNHNVAQPYRFTLGGPLRLAASAIDQYRGTDYWLATPGYLHRIAKLPAPLGQSIYVGGAYEIGQMRAPDAATITRQDVYFGLFAETPLGVVTLAPSFGDHGERKFTFTLGKFF
ncbi:patatin-like phospholipase family protein [Granulicella cerasi]|uniref:Patatin-like phospholipase family protein n=1 Tax=Granulicella cerasi TaxID=741063 RepID=A0ABW1ZBH8_9BACT|nr:patatin-like phospholipase family protein [Granulicella cerasi]